MQPGFNTRIVDIPEIPLKNIADLEYFKNLEKLEVFSSKKISGVKAIGKISSLKNLIFQSENITSKQLREIAKSGTLESLTIPFLDIDYTCLSRMPNLKTITITSSFYKEPSDYSPLLKLPSEGCLLDVAFINNKSLTPELYAFLNTHLNVSSIGELQVYEKYDLGFLKKMSQLEEVKIGGRDVDLKGISKMVWLKKLKLSDDNIVENLS